jgi:adenosyl cobinamide kinase/adenosyl cobinamide phosphate guanylyltransferase
MPKGSLSRWSWSATKWGSGWCRRAADGRRFRDALGLVNQRAAAAAAEVHLCVAGVELRIK